MGGEVHGDGVGHVGAQCCDVMALGFSCARVLAYYFVGRFQKKDYLLRKK